MQSLCKKKSPCQKLCSISHGAAGTEAGSSAPRETSQYHIGPALGPPASSQPRATRAAALLGNGKLAAGSPQSQELCPATGTEDRVVCSSLGLAQMPCLSATSPCLRATARYPSRVSETRSPEPDQRIFARKAAVCSATTTNEICVRWKRWRNRAGSAPRREAG